MAVKQILTREGLKRLEEELETLKTVTRRELADKIKEAMSFGDLSENSEYDEAKNEQGIVEARISEIEKTLLNVELLDEDALSIDVVAIGNRVKIKNLSTGAESAFQIVGSKEVNIKEGKISDESPVGKACIGFAVGDKVEASTPNGIVSYEIIDISK